MNWRWSPFGCVIHESHFIFVNKRTAKIKIYFRQMLKYTRFRCFNSSTNDNNQTTRCSFTVTKTIKRLKLILITCNNNLKKERENKKNVVKLHFTASSRRTNNDGNHRNFFLFIFSNEIICFEAFVLVGLSNGYWVVDRIFNFSKTISTKLNCFYRLSDIGGQWTTNWSRIWNWWWIGSQN